jgi:hypothetical protein
VDDWDGFGQIPTVSGTATFRDVLVELRHLVRDEARPKYFPAFFELVHLATLAGIGRAASTDLARLVGERRRTYTPTVRGLLRTRRFCRLSAGYAARSMEPGPSCYVRRRRFSGRSMPTKPVTLKQKTTLSRSPSWRSRNADRGVRSGPECPNLAV